MRRIHPTPANNSPEKFWIQFTIETDPWDDSGGDRLSGVKGINNMNTLPFQNIAYDSVNSIGKQWIRRFALALTKEMLGQIRGKFNTVPIPGESITLNYSDLLSQAKAEQDALRSELKETFDELTYSKLAETDGTISDNAEKVLADVPTGIYVG